MICIEMQFKLAETGMGEFLQDYLVIENNDNAVPDELPSNNHDRCLCLGCVWETDGLAHWYIRRDLDESVVEELGHDRRSKALKRIADMLPRFYWLPVGEDIFKEQQVRGSKFLKNLVDDFLSQMKQLEEAPHETDINKDHRPLQRQLGEIRQDFDSLKQRFESLQELPSPLTDLAHLLVRHMKTIMPSVEAQFAYSVGLPEDYWKWFDVSMVKLDDGWMTSVADKGHGAQRTFAVALLRAYVEYKTEQQAEEHNFLIALEEPEVFMHPHIARTLAKNLLELSKSGQVILSTHSPTFVKVIDWENLILVRKPEKASWLKQVPSDVLSGKQRDRIRRTVDPSECEILFASRVILVEGDTELFAVPGFIQTLVRDDAHSFRYEIDEAGISIVAVGGATGFEPYFVLLKHFEVPVTVLTDLDAIGEVVRQMNKAGMLSQADMDEYNGYGGDLDQKRQWLRQHHCFVLDGDFEIEVARALTDDERIYDIIDIAREKKGLPALDTASKVSFPGDTAAQIDATVQSWVRELWDRGIKRDIETQHRDVYKEQVLAETNSETTAWLSQVASRIIDNQHWAVDSREKWFASKMTDVGKPLMGQVLGEELTSDEIQSIRGLNVVFDHLVDVMEEL